MADRDRERERERQQAAHQLQVHPQHRFEGGQKYMGQQQGGGPSASKVLAVLTMLPVGGTLLFLAGMTLIGTVIGLLLATPVFIICSPVLVPAAIAIGLAVTGFLGSGAMGLTALSSLSWVFNYLRGASAAMPEHVDNAKRRMQEAAGQMGQKTKEVGQTIQSKAQEGEQKRT